MTRRGGGGRWRAVGAFLQGGGWLLLAKFALGLVVAWGAWRAM